MQEVDVLLFGPLAELAATPSVRLDVGNEARVADILAKLREKFPAIGPRLDATAVALNLSYVGRDAVVRPGDEVALIPPVSGG
jgi:molybdopterin converting factor subunit 1